MNKWFFELRIYALALLALLLPAQRSMAAQTNFYTDVSFVYHTVETAGKTLNPHGAKLKLGLPVTHNFAIEASYAASVNDDEVNALKLEIARQTSVHLRYQGASSENGMTVFLLLGQSWTTMKTSGANALPDQDYRDLSWGIGVEDFAQGIKNLYYSFQYTRDYDDDKLTVSGISLGLRYTF